MDKIDLQIVRMLQKDGRLSHEQISREIHLSRPAVHDRIKRLEQAGVIWGYSAQVDWAATGLPLSAFIWVRVSNHTNEVGQKILALSNEETMVEQCMRVAGEWCLIVQTRSASAVALQDFLDEVLNTPGVQNTMTTIALSAITPIDAPRAATVGERK
jgi:Lrp/AsnC family leucine-responsive transcriptional regulator